MSQREVNRALKSIHTIPVHILRNSFQNHIIPPQLIRLEQTGLQFEGRDLLHAIGAKTAALPSSRSKECVKNAYLYANILDFRGQHLGYKLGNNYGSDLQTNRSNELGIGIGCLVAQKLFNLKPDKLELIVGPGRRFDYRATSNNSKHVYEFKGTKHLYKQNEQISDGIEKKNVMHNRNENYDVEMVISTCIRNSNEEPNIIIADPKFSGYEQAFTEDAGHIYRLRHFARIAQFVGLNELSRGFYMASKFYFNDRRKILLERSIQQLIDIGIFQLSQLKETDLISESSSTDTIFTKVNIKNHEFYGRWVTNWRPKTEDKNGLESDNTPIEVFQGITDSLMDFIHKDYSSILSEEFEFKEEVFISENETEYKTYNDGTVMAFRTRSR